jgi:hypothetical protein
MSVPVLISSCSGCIELCDEVIMGGKVTIVHERIELVEGTCARVLPGALSR